MLFVVLVGFHGKPFRGRINVAPQNMAPCSKSGARNERARYMKKNFFFAPVLSPLGYKPPRI